MNAIINRLVSELNRLDFNHYKNPKIELDN